MNISLTPDLKKFVKRKIASGRYLSADEVVCEALRLLEKQDQPSPSENKELILNSYQGKGIMPDLDDVIRQGLERYESRKRQGY
jgi:putative addiction module CopG family antidote